MEDQQCGQIIFFDGICGLCNRFVDFVISRDHKKRFLFAPLQGKTAASFNIRSQTPDSMIFKSNGWYYKKSTAALKILILLGGGWKLLHIFFIFPRFLRDFIYDLIAKNRYKMFGTVACRIPSAEEKTRILD